MLNPKVMMGECSIQVMLRGELVMTIPHRMWESGVDERGEVMWGGEMRGDHTTILLVRYLEGKIRGSEDQKGLFNRLDEFMGELKFSQWRKTMREEGIEKKTKKEEREGRNRDRAAPEEGAPVEEWRLAA